MSEFTGWKLNSKEFKEGFTEIDLNAETAKGLISTSLVANKVMINTAVPRHWKIVLNSKSLEIDAVVHLLSEKLVLSSVVAAISSYDFVEKFFAAATSSKSGTFHTNTALLSYDLIIMKVKEILNELGFESSDKVTLVVTALMIDVLNELGIVAYSGSSVSVETKTRLFPDYNDLVVELRRAKLSYALSSMDKTRLKTTAVMGVGIVASFIHNSLTELGITLSRLEHVEQDLESIFSLVRAYTLKSYEDYTADELGIFEDREFLELATNFTVINIAMSSGFRLRPATGAYFWPQIIARTNLALRSSSTIGITDLNAVKEYFQYDVIHDRVGLKKGVVLTKNCKEDAPFEAYIPVLDRLGFQRVIKDQTAEVVLAPLASQFKRITSQTIHEYYTKMFSLITVQDSPTYIFNTLVSETDLVHLSASLAHGLEVGKRMDGEVVSYQLIYRVNVNDSRVSENTSALGITKYTDAAAVLFYGVDHWEGRRILAYSAPVIAEVNKVSYAGLNGISTKPIGEAVKLSLDLGNGKFSTSWELDRLFGIPNLENTRVISPVVGAIITSRFVDGFNELKSVAKSKFDMGKSFETTMALSFTKALDPIFVSKDINDLTTSVISKIWEDNVHQSKTSKRDTAMTGKYLQSMFYEDAFKAEMKFRIGLFVAYKLGFITDPASIKKIVDVFKECGGFDHI